ncbi:MAG: (2Fe-2S)-binding protein [Acidobacteriia bacterium]|jgi:sarcosine oxidase subunit alpha|nr:(2Fe-2S)-binding protein [Terriglobia bacterium]
MPEPITVTVNGTSLAVPGGATVAVAIVLAGAACRKSVTGETRGPLCGMGICYECRAVINGQLHCRSCQIICQPGMEVRTDE